MSEKVTLNIGGIRYETYKETLLSVQDSKFAELISEKETVTNEYFIDANGKYFEIILDFLRGRIKYFTDLPLDVEILKSLKRESDFYKLLKLKCLTEKALEKFDLIPQQWLSRHIDNGNNTLKSMNFQHCEMNEYVKMEKINFQHNANFSYSVLQGAFFRNCVFNGDISITFEKVDMTRSTFKNCKFENKTQVIFKEADLTEVQFDECQFKDQAKVYFHKVNLTKGKFAETFVRDDATLDFNDVNVNNCTFRNFGKQIPGPQEIDIYLGSVDAFYDYEIPPQITFQNINIDRAIFDPKELKETIKERLNI